VALEPDIEKLLVGGCNVLALQCGCNEGDIHIDGSPLFMQESLDPGSALKRNADHEVGAVN
jgi:hypothetical protein